VLVLESILLILVVKIVLQHIPWQTGNHLNLLSISADGPEADIMMTQGKGGFYCRALTFPQHFQPVI
jgi:hypothetical protein